MAKKEFTFQGKTLAELQKLSDSEFIELIPSRQRRSVQRGFTDQQKVLLKKLEKKDNVKTHNRELVIFPRFVGKTIKVHNGKTFFDVFVTEEMLGRVLGEFSLSKGKVGHSSPGVGQKKKK